MLTLLRVNTLTDWKGRPNVCVTVIAKSDKRDELVAAQDADVDLTKRRDILDDIDMETETALEEGRPPVKHNGNWRIDGERWEMDRDKPEELRQLCGKYIDGDTWSTTYHIIEL